MNITNFYWLPSQENNLTRPQANAPDKCVSPLVFGRMFWSRPSVYFLSPNKEGLGEEDIIITHFNHLTNCTGHIKSLSYLDKNIHMVL